VETVVSWDDCAVDNGGASSDGGDDFSERRHFESWKWKVSHGLYENWKVGAKGLEEEMKL
jgi:hypothetical protein